MLPSFNGRNGARGAKPRKRGWNKGLEELFDQG